MSTWVMRRAVTDQAVEKKKNVGIYNSTSKA